MAGSKEDLRGLMTLPEAENSLSAEAEDAETKITKLVSKYSKITENNG